MARIDLIGAGSVVFTRNLINDVLSFPALQGSTISLMDIDADRLRLAQDLADLGDCPYPAGSRRSHI